VCVCVCVRVYLFLNTWQSNGKTTTQIQHRLFLEEDKKKK